MNEAPISLKKARLIVGLGNPGKEYARTRHNLGWMVAEELGRKHGWSFKEEKRFNAWIAKGSIGEVDIHLLLPTTFMNLSGHAVEKYLSYFKLNAGDLIIVTDDASLDFGEARVRTFGSSGGHNGLKSIENVLGTRHYIRLRMGIGADPEKGVLADYVLDAFTRDEENVLADVVRHGADVLQRLTQEKVEQVMNQVNTKKQKKNCRPPCEGQENKNESRQAKSI